MKLGISISTIRFKGKLNATLVKSYKEPWLGGQSTLEAVGMLEPRHAEMEP